MMRAMLMLVASGCSSAPVRAVLAKRLKVAVAMVAGQTAEALLVVTGVEQEVG